MEIAKLIAVFYVSLLAGVGAEEEDFVPLFNGKDLSGWRFWGGTADYKVDGGTIPGTTAAGSPNSFLCTEEHYFDFDLRFEVKLGDDELNSGCQVRSNTSADPSAKSKEMERFAAQLRAAGEKGRTEWQLKEAVAGDSIQYRDGLFYQANESEPYSGYAKRMYDSGQVKGLIQYKDGKPGGLVTAWRENGQKQAEETFKDGEEVSAKYWNSKGEEVETEDESRK